jgi:GxxExxY protein
MNDPVEAFEEQVAAQVVDASYMVHTFIGPGILESCYQALLLCELRHRGLRVMRNVEQPVYYRDIELKVGYRIDLLVEERIVVELKAVATILPIHQAQLLTYLRLSNLRLGFLINFHSPLLKDGIKRIINSSSVTRR